MQSKIRDLKLVLGRLDQRHIRLALVVLSLALFVLGAGAPDAPGGGGGG